MSRFIKDRKMAKGQAPGSLVFIGQQKMEAPVLHWMSYDTKQVNEDVISELSDFKPTEDENSVSWINIYGIHEPQLIQDIGNTFQLSPLLLEDMMNTDQRPRFQSYENHDVFILKVLHRNQDSQRFTTEQISLVIGENYLLTIQERKMDLFKGVRERIKKGKGKIRSKGHDYLAYALLDTIADNYLEVLGTLGNEIENLEDQIFSQADSGTLEKIYQYKLDVNLLRKAIRPVRELIPLIIKSEESQFQASTIGYLNDLHELLMQVSETVELYGNILSDQWNVYNTSVSNRMNEIMKVLTIFASIFIPLTFLAGIYGMNFEFIPELKYKFSYPIFWGVSIALIIGLLLFFKKRKWF